MTVERFTTFDRWIASGTQVDFVFSFEFIVNTDVKVYLNDIVEPVASYQVFPATDNVGGKITFSTPPPAGTPVSIVRGVPYDQLTVYPPYGPFPAKSHELALDKLTMLIQQAKDASTVLLSANFRYSGLWQPNTFYSSLNIVEYNSNIYMARADFTSGSSFDPGNWTILLDLHDFWLAVDEAKAASIAAEASAVRAEEAAVKTDQAGGFAANAQLSAQQAANCAHEAFSHCSSLNIPDPNTGNVGDSLIVGPGNQWQLLTAGDNIFSPVRNYFENGMLDNWQYGTSPHVHGSPDGFFLADRLWLYNSARDQSGTGSISVAFSQQVMPPGEVPGNPLYFLRVHITGYAPSSWAGTSPNVVGFKINMKEIHRFVLEPWLLRFMFRVSGASPSNPISVSVGFKIQVSSSTNTVAHKNIYTATDSDWHQVSIDGPLGLDALRNENDYCQIDVRSYYRDNPSSPQEPPYAANGSFDFAKIEVFNGNENSKVESYSSVESLHMCQRFSQIIHHVDPNPLPSVIDRRPSMISDSYTFWKVIGGDKSLVSTEYIHPQS